MNRKSFARNCLLAAGLAVAVILPTGAYLQQAVTPSHAGATVSAAVRHAVSPPLRNLVQMEPDFVTRMANASHAPVESKETRSFTYRGTEGATGIETRPPVAMASLFPATAILAAIGQDPYLQTKYPATILPVYGVSIDGIGAENPGVWPPDTIVAVGDHQVVQVVNVRLAIYDKFGHLQAGPVPIGSLFSPLTGSLCSDTNNGGAPNVLYDRIAQRWLITRLSRPNPGTAPWHLCIAVSQGPEADLSSYNLYDFDYGTNKPDSPKFGVWPDAYYFSANTFANSATFVGAKVCAFDRNAMILGSSNPQSVCFQGNTSLRSILPSSLDGTTAPPAGSPNFYLQYDPSNKLSLYKFHVDFTTPSLSSLTGPTNIPVGTFIEAGAADLASQPGVTDKLAVMGNRLNYRLSYRNFGSHESLLVNHTVRVSPITNQTALRWYEIRRPNGVPLVSQQSTFSPDTNTYRWVGSMAQDKQGNMLVQYNASSSSLYPSIRYTGRLSTDPLNQMEREGTIHIGGGSQINPAPGTSNRWANWASLALDPVDDCTFWFAAEYLKATGPAPNWSTRIASVRFPTCS